MVPLVHNHSHASTHWRSSIRSRPDVFFKDSATCKRGGQGSNLVIYKINKVIYRLLHSQNAFQLQQKFLQRFLVNVPVWTSFFLCSLNITHHDDNLTNFILFVDICQLEPLPSWDVCTDDSTHWRTLFMEGVIALNFEVSCHQSSLDLKLKSVHKTEQNKLCQNLSALWCLLTYS